MEKVVFFTEDDLDKKTFVEKINKVLNDHLKMMKEMQEEITQLKHGLDKFNEDQDDSDSWFK